MFIDYMMNISENSHYQNYIKDDFSQKLSFFIEASGEFFALSNYYTKREGYKSLLLIYTIDGVGEMFYNNVSFTLPEKSLILINCSNFQYYKSASANWHFMYMHISNDTAFDLTNQLFSDTFFYCQNITNPQVYQNINNIVNNQNVNSKIKNLQNEKYVSDILSALYLLSATAPMQKSINQLTQIDDYILANYTTNINLDQICHKFGFSKFNFIRLFKKIKNVSPYQYIILLRLSLAKELLIKTDNTIEEIANLTCYDSATNLIRAFKKHYHTSPSKLRKS